MFSDINKWLPIHYTEIRNFILYFIWSLHFFVLMHTVVLRFHCDVITGTLPLPKLVTYLDVEVVRKKYFNLQALNRRLNVMFFGYVIKGYSHKRAFHLNMRLKKKI